MRSRESGSSEMKKFCDIFHESFEEKAKTRENYVHSLQPHTWLRALMGPGMLSHELWNPKMFQEFREFFIDFNLPS